MLVVFLLLITKNCRQPSTGEWINKPWYIHTMEHYLGMKGINYWHIQKFGWISGNDAKWKKPEKEAAIWLYLYDILVKAKL